MTNLNKLTADQGVMLQKFANLTLSEQMSVKPEMLKNADLMFKKYSKNPFWYLDHDMKYMNYLVTIIASSYFLCDNVDLSVKLARTISKQVDLDAQGLEYILIWLLQADYDNDYVIGTASLKIEIIQATKLFININDESDELLKVAHRNLYNYLYHGSPREKLFANIIQAVIIKTIEYKSKNLL
jgi:hypothetical protein